MPYGPKRMTLADAKALLRPHSVVLTKRDGEYQVKPRGAGERSTYYTNDLWDAVATGATMRRRTDPRRVRARRAR